MKRPWVYLEKEQLILQNFRDLDFELSEHPVWEACLQVCSELKEKGLKITPHFWIADEWFVPDGVRGIGVPFWCLEPILREVHQEQVGEIDGETYEEWLKIIRHECAHVLDNAFHLRKLRDRQEIFGPCSKRYPKTYSPNPESTDFVENLPDYYAQAHPEEDWAETFAVWLGSKKYEWRTKYKGTKALEKLRYLDSVMTELKGKRVLYGKKTTPYKITNSKQSLEEFYIERRKDLNIRRRPYFLKETQTVFTQRPGTVAAGEFLERNRSFLVRNISKQLGRHEFQVGRLIKDIERSGENLYLKKSQNETKKALLAMIQRKGDDFYKKGLHRIIM